jgi:hypothetical protein
LTRRASSIWPCRLTYQNIRSLIVGKVGDGGEEAMSVAEKTVEIVQKVSTEGPQALWEEAKDKCQPALKMTRPRHV